MRALSIRQPYAELILRGLKTIEYRTRRTRIIGEPFFIYASRTPGAIEGFAVMPLDCDPDDLPTGVIVGTAMITHCVWSPDHAHFAWHLDDVRRLDLPLRKPKRQPQPVWFRPF